MDAITAITSRKSTRAYTEQPVSHEAIEALLECASRAPSGVNSQPWHVCVLQGKTKEAVTAALISARDQKLEPNPDYDYYPKDWIEPYSSRRVACGKALYNALGIRHGQRDRQMLAWENNYRFFGAPVGLLFFIDQVLKTGSWVDIGMFIQNVMIAANASGLATCPQASLAEYPDIVREILAIEPSRRLVCGMSLGYADLTHPVNQYQLSRVKPAEFTRWYD